MSARRHKPGAAAAARRVRHLIALDAANVVSRLRARRTEMVHLFSRLRDRGPLLKVIQNWFHSASFGDLARLEPFEQQAINRFYEVLGDLRWYLEYTEDMPLQIQHHLTEFTHRLEASHRRLTAAIGPPDAEGAPVVEAVVVEEPDAKVAALQPQRSRQR
jgi:hypothetical protein